MYKVIFIIQSGGYLLKMLKLLVTLLYEKNFKVTGREIYI